MTDPLLNQMLAVKAGLKGRTDTEITAIYHDLQKVGLFNGLTRTYHPKDDGGDTFPDEYTKVQQDVEARLGDIAAASIKLWDVVLTVDEGNTAVRGSVKIGGRELFSAPNTFLLYLQKQLVHLRTVISKVPVLDPAVRWEEDTTSDAKWRSAVEKTNRPVKVKKTHVLVPATEKHPAQAQAYEANENAGTWELTKFSSAITGKRRDELLARVNELIDAVRSAIQEANASEVQQKNVGEGIFAYLLA